MQHERGQQVALSTMRQCTKGGRWNELLARRYTASTLAVEKAAFSLQEVSFFTDVEGSLPFFHKAVEFSSAVRFKNVQPDGGSVQLGNGGSVQPVLELIDPQRCGFVYGGDVVDHGTADIRIARALVGLKQRYPDRVFLLAGNRDINKLFLTSLVGTLFDEDPVAASVLLRESLSKRMGSPNAFEGRRHELAEMSKVNLSEVDDCTVTSSYIEMLQPGGFMIEYLKHAQIAACVGDALFVHGGLPASGVGHIPETLESGRQVYLHILNSQ